MNFEWNLEKNAENARKHGITLASAARVFQDENRLGSNRKRKEAIL